MQAAVAEAVAQSTREQAATDARNDLRELRRRAVEAGRDRSRKIVKTSRIDNQTGEIRYNPAGRLLRDWYLHVYMNTLRANLGEPAVTIDAQQMEDMTAQLRRLRPASEALDALRAVGVIRNVAVDDAAHAAADTVAHLGAVAMRRAVLHAADDRFDGDELAVHVTRHWYQRCYDDQVHGATRSRHPLAEVTKAEEDQLALVLTSGYARRLMGEDGIPLVTAHGTVLTDRERRIAAGEVGLVSAISDVQHHTDTTQNLRQRVMHTWRDLAPDERDHWLQLAGADRTTAELSWSALDPTVQSKIIKLYLDTHSPSQIGVQFEGAVIMGEPRLAAQTMFAHQRPLDASDADKQDHRSESAPSQDAPSAAGLAVGSTDAPRPRSAGPL